MASFHGRSAFDKPSSLLSLDLVNHPQNHRIICSFCLVIRRGVEACYQVLQPFEQLWAHLKKTTLCFLCFERDTVQLSANVRNQ